MKHERRRGDGKYYFPCGSHAAHFGKTSASVMAESPGRGATNVLADLPKTADQASALVAMTMACPDPRIAEKLAAIASRYAERAWAEAASVLSGRA